MLKKDTRNQDRKASKQRRYFTWKTNFWKKNLQKQKWKLTFFVSRARWRVAVSAGSITVVCKTREWFMNFLEIQIYWLLFKFIASMNTPCPRKPCNSYDWKLKKLHPCINSFLISQVKSRKYCDAHFWEHCLDKLTSPAITICSGHNVAICWNQSKKHGGSHTHSRCWQQCWFCPLKGTAPVGQSSKSTSISNIVAHNTDLQSPTSKKSVLWIHVMALVKNW